MRIKYEIFSQQNQALFSAEDLAALKRSNFGLRLTNHSDEKEQGGCGAAVPLSNLAGSDDIIQFVTLVCYLLANPELEKDLRNPIQKQLEAIYDNLTNYSFNKDPTRASLEWLPELILTYAQLVGVGDSKKLEPQGPRLPLNEEQILVQCYSHLSIAILSAPLFDGPNFWSELATLKQRLVANFNQQLFYRLTYNQGFYNSKTMSYLLLIADTSRFEFSEDLSHYPMGKVGESRFSAKEVLADYSFLVNSSLKDNNLISELFVWLKTEVLNYKLKFKTSESRLDKKPVEEGPSCFDQARQFCADNKKTIGALSLIGLFAGMKIVEYCGEYMKFSSPRTS